ncbi:MAG: hypothetical protein H0X62_04115 [Bacteroidetes bacterium]|nr:hypothetical protein [Bacteroidota bacterium]
MHEIRQFLQSEKDYKTGILLYQKWGKNDTLKRVFARGESSFNKKKLLAELEKLAPVKPVRSEASPIISKSSYDDPALVPLYREQSMLHNQLTRMSREERKTAAFRILNIADEIEGIARGTVKVLENVLPDSPLAMQKLLLNNRSYISRFVNDPGKVGEMERRRKENEVILKRISE